MKELEKATFAAGCFWGVEYNFSKLPGVVSTLVGYTGGDDKNYPNPNYEQVCSGKTGYAEVIEIKFDTKKISYEKLLEAFWKMHDPTSLNRQGLDVGTQYKSAIFYHNPSQKSLAIKSKKVLQKKLGNEKIVTEIVKATKFYHAEEYYQKYIEKTGRKVC